MNNCKKHWGKIKIGGYKGGRGYCGFHTTHFGKSVYLRSIQEFIYAKYLDSIGVYYLTENVVYDIEGKKYKPDFFIYDGELERLVKIVEVKYTNSEQLEYQKRFADYFKCHNIDYQVLSKYDIKKLLRMGVVSEKEIFEWRQAFTSKYARFDYTGEKNPMYGVRHSKATKDLIGMKTVEYFKNPVVRERHRRSRIAYWNSESGVNTKKKYAELRIKESLRKNPIMEVVCKECGMEYKRKLKDRYHIETCSNSCQQKYNWRIGKNAYHGGAGKTYRSRIMEYFKVLIKSGHCITAGNYDNVVQYQKSLGTIPKHFGMNLSIVKKYFGSLTNLKKEVHYGKTY